MTRAVCEWTQEDEGSDCYETSCHHVFTIIDGTPTDNHFRFCVFCGRSLEQELYVLEDAP